MLDKIKQSKFGEHNLLLHKDYVKLSNIRLEYSKTALESLNELVSFCLKMGLSTISWPKKYWSRCTEI